MVRKEKEYWFRAVIRAVYENRPATFTKFERCYLDLILNQRITIDSWEAANALSVSEKRIENAERRIIQKLVEMVQDKEREVYPQHIERIKLL